MGPRLIIGKNPSPFSTRLTRRKASSVRYMDTFGALDRAFSLKKLIHK